MRQLTNTEIDAVYGGGKKKTVQLNASKNLAVVVLSKDTNVIQGSNINGSIVVQS